MNATRQLILTSAVVILFACGGLGCASEETRAWNEAREKPSIEGFRNFIGRFPASPNIAQANQELERLSWEAAARSDTLVDYVRFRESFSAAGKREAAEGKIRDKVTTAIDQAFLAAFRGGFSQAMTGLNSVLAAGIEDPVALNNYGALQVRENQEPETVKKAIAMLERARTKAEQRVIALLTGTILTETTQILGQPPFDLQMFLYPGTSVVLKPFDWKAFPQGVFMTKDDVFVDTISDRLWGKHSVQGNGASLVVEIDNNLRKLEALLKYVSSKGR